MADKRNTQLNVKWKLIPESNRDLGFIEIEYFEDKGNCHIEVIDCSLNIETAFSDSNYKMTLMQLRKQIEPKGYKIACNGCLPNITYSGMLLESSLGLAAYFITDINEPVDVSITVKTFGHSSSILWADLATLEGQQRFRKMYYESAVRNSERWSERAKINKQKVIKKTNNSRAVKTQRVIRVRDFFTKKPQE